MKIFFSFGEIFKTWCTFMKCDELFLKFNELLQIDDFFLEIDEIFSENISRAFSYWNLFYFYELFQGQLSDGQPFLL